MRITYSHFGETDVGWKVNADLIDDVMGGKGATLLGAE